MRIACACFALTAACHPAAIAKLGTVTIVSVVPQSIEAGASATVTWKTSAAGSYVASMAPATALERDTVRAGVTLTLTVPSSALLRASGGQADGLQVDLASYDGVEKLYAKIKAMGRPIAAIAINAGVGVGGDFAQGTDLQDELNLINLNVVSTVHLAKRVVSDMIDNGGGRILFTASIAGSAPGPYEAVYAASKAFVLSFSEAIRNELKDTGITVTALMPGATETNFFHRAGMEDTKVGAGKKDDPALVAKQGYEALMAGKDAVVAGSLKVKVQGALNEILPETSKAALHGSQTRPGSAHKR